MINYPLLNDKFRDFLDYPSYIDFMEGTTYGGKTTVGLVKFMERVITSDMEDHLISGKNKGVIERNLINKDYGILDVWGDFVTYKSYGDRYTSKPHIKVKIKGQKDKIIYISGYGDKKQYSDVLGGQFGCVLVDEVNEADDAFLDALFLPRFNDYLIATLNPDKPDKSVYTKFINRSRPVEEYKYDAPKSIQDDLVEPEGEGWVHWFFSYDDNPSLSEERRHRLITNTPRGTPEYKSKILGERSRAEGLVFPNFGSQNILPHSDVLSKEYVQLNVGIDTSYSTKSDDANVFSLIGLTPKGELVIIDEYVFNNKGRESNPLTPIDVSNRFWDTYEEWEEIGTISNIYIDNADQATKNEMNKDAKARGIKKRVGDSKKLKIKNRVNYTNGWIDTREDSSKVNYYVSSGCKTHINEMSNYSYEDEVPEDKNDHTINASQYAWAKLVGRIGVIQQDKREQKAGKRKAKRML